MGVYFGTDGIRGIFNKDLNVDLAYKIGNALGFSESKKISIIIGRDTRKSGDILTLALVTGAMNSGADITDVGICPTAAISYFTTHFNFDYGVIITASHNPAEYNGIKIFDKTGKKLDEIQENLLEEKLNFPHTLNYKDVGRYYHKPQFIDKYIEFIGNLFNFDLSNKKIVLDCANGASSFIASRVFKNKNANVVSINCNPDGININKACGALFTECIKNEVIKHNADFGFAYDGDSDRLIAVTEKGEVLSGDVIIYIFTMYYKNNNLLSIPTVVGTKHTNMGLENALLSKGINLIRTDVGDKYISQELESKNLSIGGEQSGHIIVKEYLPTGDGILNSIFLTYICSKTKKKLSEYNNIKLFSQTNINITVKDKLKIKNNPLLKDLIQQKENELKNNGRILVRVSGTEPCLRVMVESFNEMISNDIANEISNLIKKLDDNI